ncbi:MAG: protein of unknown function LppY and LpqO [Gemmatimonadetes bacterium]|nr:protein of unknown function LppY and LpqO [Gemmatimonadota bacterium]
MRRAIYVLQLVLLARVAPAQAHAASASWGDVDTALGRPGSPQPGGVYKYAFPRSDLAVVAGGVTLKPALALGSWVAFMRVSSTEAICMGDLVLLESEVGDVMRALQAAGIDQSALHNHLLMETPHVMYMHVMARGNAVRIATSIRAALARSATPLGPPAPPAAASAAELDTAAIAHALRYSGKLNGVVYQVAVPRREKVTEMGHVIPPSMGLATAINFQPTGGGRAAITGDFVMRGPEVNKVIRALLAHGIQPTGLHSHLIDEQPHLYFMHFWANDDAVTLAKGLRAALDVMNVQAGSGQ